MSRTTPNDRTEAAVKVELEMVAETIGNELDNLSAAIEHAERRAAAATREAEGLEERRLGILDLLDRLPQVDTDTALATASMLQDARRDEEGCQ